ncbi:MAG: DUF5050 domain-containing protein [Bacillota bacterium]|nr:DUF5050 domain-containing protein [Bacillota bacterium]
MKKIMVALSLLLAVALLASCGADVIAEDEFEQTPAPTGVLSEDGTPPELGFNDTLVGEWIYYLDENDPAQVNGSEQYPLHRAKRDGSEDEDLKVTGILFTVAGDYIYLNINEQEEGIFPQWETLRVSLDGKEVERIDYSNTTRFSSAGEDAMYFSCFNDSTIYKSDAACENVIPLKVVLTDKEAITDKLGENTVLSIIIGDADSEWIGFGCTVSSTTTGEDLYTGGYRISQDGKTVDKTDDGEYFVDMDMMDEEAGE